MSGNKRQRELARAKYERQQARRATSGSRRRRNQKIIAVLVVVALVVGSVAWVVYASTRSDDAVASPSSSIDPSQLADILQSAQAAAEAASPEPSASVSASPELSPSAGTTDEPIGEPAILDCHAPGTVRANNRSYASAPTDQTATSITFTTNCGNIVIALDPNAPATVSSEVFLASEGFYDNTQCHRLTTAGIFVLQCGDPAGDGTGGPGYVVPDENLPAEGAANYPAGTVAMANAGPGTGGSQFFLVYGDTTLPSGYTIWGTVTEGLDIIKEIASVGVADGTADGAPRQPVFIESATVQS